jgi:hypothetical protein
MRRPLILSLCLLSVLLVFASSVLGQRKMTETEVRGHTMYTLLAPGAIPPILEPKFINADSAAQLYHDDEPLIVVVDGDQAKGYSIWHLDQHEIVNDYINSRAITVTW